MLHPYPDVGWILKQLISEAKRRGLDYQRALPQEKAKVTTETEEKDVLRFQLAMQDLLKVHGLLEEFNDKETQQVYLKLRKEDLPDLTIKREKQKIIIAHYMDDESKEGEIVFEFKRMIYNDNWRPESIIENGKTIKVMISEDNSPALSMRGFLTLKEKASEFTQKILKENWEEAETVIKQVDNQDLLDTKNAVPISQGLPERISKFQRVIEKILKKNDLLEKFNDPKCSSVYLKLHQDAYMDLVIERQVTDIFIGHYRKENGDVISDPVLRFRFVEGFHEWKPIAIEQVFGTSWVEFEQYGKTFINRRVKSSFRIFAKMFADNIEGQGWDEAEAILKEVEGDEEEIQVSDTEIEVPQTKMTPVPFEEKKEELSIVYTTQGQGSFAW